MSACRIRREPALLVALGIDRPHGVPAAPGSSPTAEDQARAKSIVERANRLQVGLVAETARPSDLLGIAKVCQLFGCDRAALDHHGFPEPWATVSGVPIWTQLQVARWALRTERVPDLEGTGA